VNGDGNINTNDKLSLPDAKRFAEQATVGGYTDWRLPTIKELYSLILFDGKDPSGLESKSTTVSLHPFIDNATFSIAAGDTFAGERIIDGQFLSQTEYTSKTMNKDDTVFGVNFIDGRIKGYGTSLRGRDKTFYVLLVRGNENYGENNFSDANNQTIVDSSTGLTWQKSDSKTDMNWTASIDYCESLSLGGTTDWRLPNAKELHSIVDYNLSPEAHNSPAINPIFNSTEIQNEAGQTDWASYWTSTLHKNVRGGANGVYISFGRSMGNMNGTWLDAHGAGAQRSDPLSGDASKFSEGHGPQGDAIRINNKVRCVTGGVASTSSTTDSISRTAMIVEVSESTTSNQNQKNNENSPARSGIENRNGPGSGETLLQIMDANKDGKLSKSEVRGPLLNDFDKLDRNNDGFLTTEELPTQPKNETRLPPPGKRN
jgi:hypothetical protein